MIGCDNEKCLVEWFHFECVQLKVKPKGKWYCPMCRGDRFNVLKVAVPFTDDASAFQETSTSLSDENIQICALSIHSAEV
ncbi:unnamed protein product [Toxocara canis]|uniref:PHD domain-containing protein n=1 Tax=Toxocara canis TaxID=6265 RepID=A0A183U3M1_TOXCA|nr:unnamed protein product [Toxocara canis]